MIAGLKPYPKMRDSGVAWLGDVPYHWQVQRLKTLLRERDERSSTGDEQLLSVSQYTGVSERRLADGSDEIDSRAVSLVGYKKAAVDDLVINIMLAWNGSLGISRYNGIVSPAYCVYRFTTPHEPWFLHHLLRTDLYKTRIKTSSRGVVESRLRLYTDDLFRIEALVPPLDEQADIVRFLDHADRRIRRSIAAKQKMIRLLEEQKAAIIHQAVTRGLRATAPTKVSGVPWLGDVPAHWLVLPLKRVARFKSGAGFPVEYQKGARIGEVPFLKVSDMTLPGNDRDIIDQRNTVSTGTAAQLKATIFPAGAIIFPKVGGALLTNKRRVLTQPSCIDNNVMACVVQQGLIDFMFLRLLTLDLGRLSKPGPVPAIGEGEVREIKIAVPPEEEQRDIVQHVRQATVDLDKAIVTARREVDLIREYRTRLVADAVTGKLDLRAAAATLPDLEPETLNLEDQAALDEEAEVDSIEVEEEFS